MEATIVIENNNAFEPTSDDGPRANEKISVREVRLILSNGNNVGVVSTREALAKARDEGLEFHTARLQNFGFGKIQIRNAKA